MKTSRARKADELAQVPLFRGLSRAQLTKVARVADERRVRAGRAVIEERTYRSGGGSPAFYLIIAGEADVTVRARRVNRLRAGDSFGELTLLDGKPRSATIRARTDLELYRIRAWDFHSLVRSEPAIALGLLKVLAGRLRDTTPGARRRPRRG